MPYSFRMLISKRNTNSELKFFSSKLMEHINFWTSFVFRKFYIVSIITSVQPKSYQKLYLRPLGQGRFMENGTKIPNKGRQLVGSQHKGKWRAGKLHLLLKFHFHYSFNIELRTQTSFVKYSKAKANQLIQPEQGFVDWLAVESVKVLKMIELFIIRF